MVLTRCIDENTSQMNGCRAIVRGKTHTVLRYKETVLIVNILVKYNLQEINIGEQKLCTCTYVFYVEYTRWLDMYNMSRQNIGIHVQSVRFQ